MSTHTVPPTLHVARLGLSKIHVVGERRPIDAMAVERLADSIARIGLQHPITVRLVDKVDDRGFALVAGLHRLEAVRLLGHDAIDCTVVQWDEREARLWEISENLHRADLTVQQRADHIAEWLKLTGGENRCNLHQFSPWPERFSRCRTDA